MDMLFSSPESPLRSPVVEKVNEAHAALSQRTTRSEAAELALTALDAVLEETRSDEDLGATIARSGRVLLGLMFHFPSHAHQQPVPFGSAEPSGIRTARYSEFVATDGPQNVRPPAARAVSVSLPSIAAGALGAGSLNVLPDDDGSVRRVYAVIAHGGRYYMPLGLVVALHALGADASYVAGASRIQVGARSLPVSERGVALLAHLGPRKTFPHVSAADVLNEQIPRTTLQDKLVFVGYTDATRDKVISPFDPQLDGVEIHATLAHNILHHELLRRASPMTTLLTVLFLGGLLSLLQVRRIRQRRAWVAGAAALVIVIGYLVVAQVLFSEHDLVIDIAFPVLACTLITITTLLTAIATEGREKAYLRAAFSQYVSDVLVEQIVADPSKIRLGGERRELTVLFSDIRGFSSFSETLEPEVLSEYLNEYFTPMTDLVKGDGGMLDKYIGDAVMAVYGAPIDLNDHAERACKTALDMLRALTPLNEQWRQRGLPDISIGIGLNSGPMSVGNMGSKARFSYTVLGDTVNLGARLEGLTKEYRVNVLVGEDTASRADGDYVFRELDWVRVKGRSGVTRIYELIGSRAEPDIDEDTLQRYRDGLTAYRRRDWDDAEAYFTDVLLRRKQDGPAAVMIERIHALRDELLGEDWDGVFEQRSK